MISDDRKTISVMLPTFNEQENVEQIQAAVIAEIEKLGKYDYEILFIDNDSKDATRDKIRSLCASNPRIKAIFNAKNYGQFNSPYYGLLQTTGDCAIAMVADFQEPPEILIPKYVEEWEKGWKIVMCQKTTTTERGIKRPLRQFYYNFMKKHSSVEWLDQVVGSGLYDREFIEVMRKVDDPQPFLRGIVAEMGYCIKLVQFEQQDRRGGKSSNDLATYYDAAMQSVTSYTKVFVRAASISGIVVTASALVGAVITLIWKILHQQTFDQFGLLLMIALIGLIGLNMFFVGIVGEYVINVNGKVTKRPLVVESERINFDRKP